MADLKPLPGYVLIEPIDDQEETASGLILPEKAKEKPAKGKVLALGAFMESESYNKDFYDTVRGAETVVYHRWSGQDVKDGPKEYKLVKLQDLMGIYE